MKLVIELDCKGVKQNLRFLKITLNDGEPVTIPQRRCGKVHYDGSRLVQAFFRTVRQFEENKSKVKTKLKMKRR